MIMILSSHWVRVIGLESLELKLLLLVYCLCNKIFEFNLLSYSDIALSSRKVKYKQDYNTIMDKFTGYQATKWKALSWENKNLQKI